MKLREETRDLLLEIGCEELPSTPLDRAVDQLKTAVPTVLADANLTYSSIQVYETPRRIALLVSGLPLKTPDTVTEYKGPSVAAGFEGSDPTGVPTKALEGFLKSRGIQRDGIEIRTVDGSDYVYATVTQIGRPTQEILPRLLKELVDSLEWPKTQRWGSGEARFIRPVRWLVTLFGNEVIDLELFGLRADRLTRGHRFLSPQQIPVTLPGEYLHLLKASKVIADQDKRRALIIEGAHTAAAERGTVLLDEDVLAEDVNLTEYPHAELGRFDEEFLRAPREILEYAMATHQRYFAIERADGSLDNAFVVITNSDPRHRAHVVAGHERVIRARLADAVFFYDEDLKVPLEAWAEKLEGIVFQDKLGTVGDKARRIEKLAAVLAQAGGLDSAQTRQTQEAARLAKSDLASSAVIEFPNLQGIMGSYYAAAGGADPEVAAAIREHYHPRYSGDELPVSPIGRLVSIADKMDTIAGIFAAGKAPRSTSDPFGLRRAAIGVLQMLIAYPGLDLDELITSALDAYRGVIEFDFEATRDAIRAFFASRLERILRDQPVAGDAIRAVLTATIRNPADVLARGVALDAFKDHDDMVNLSQALKRTKNIAQPEVGSAIDQSLFSGAEQTLFDAISRVEVDEEPWIEQQRYTELLSAIAALRGPLNTFFEEALVMDPDDALRQNRLALLNRLLGVVERFGDISQMAVKK